MLTLSSYPELFGVADNNGYGADSSPRKPKRWVTPSGLRFAHPQG
jgi:hypothetical protein